MTSKRQDSPDGNSEGSSSTINDPVYAQPNSAPDQPGSDKSHTETPDGSSSETVRNKNDPVYSQVRENDEARQHTSQVNDPVYGQPVNVKAKSPSSGSTEAASGQVDATNDPVYSQPQASRTIVSDPVYGQDQPASAGSGSMTSATSTTDDPVYSQAPAQKSSTVSDPVYGQSQPKPSVSKGGAPGPGTGKIAPADDPVYSQSKPQDNTVNDPVYGQENVLPPAKEPLPEPSSTGTIPRQDDPVYSQPRLKNEKTLNDPVYGQARSVPPPKEPSPEPSSTTQIPPQDDPVYSQSTKRSEGATKISPEDDPVYSQSTKPTTNTTTQISPADDPVYSQSTKPREDTTRIPPQHDPAYSQSATTTNTNNNNASERLTQLTSHIAPPQTEPEAAATSNTSRPRRKRSTKSSKSSVIDPTTLPDDYSDILTHLSTLRRIAQTPDLNSRGYQRQKTSGKLWSRERIERLLDPGSWEEFGSVTGTVTWEKDAKNPRAEHVKEFVPSNNPQGFGTITPPTTSSRPRRIYLTSDDFSIRSGHADGSVAIKTLYGEKLALRLKIPVVKLVDGSSGGGSVSTIITNGYSYIPHVTVLKTVVQQLNLGIPNLGAVLGPAIGLGAARVVSTHFSVMAGDIGSLFNAGPKVVEGATFEEGLSFADLGGPDVHCRNGTIDNLAANEEECFTQLRTVLGYLPNCGMFEAPPVVENKDSIDREDISLRSIIPRKKSRGYNAYRIITSVVDEGSFFEVGGLWGRTGITGLARLGGRPVGILSLNCEVNSGALDALGSQKLMKMLKFCDVFNLPVVQFVDVPGYAIGTVAERTATMKWGVELGKAYYSTTTPIFSVITRRVYGVAGGIMLDSRDPWMRIAWPSGNWGSLPLDGGIEVGHRHELKEIGAAQGPEAAKKRYQELEDEYIRLMNPVRTATCFNVEEIVDPKDTRGICCRWVAQMYGLPMTERLADRASGKIHAVFT